MEAPALADAESREKAAALDAAVERYLGACAAPYSREASPDAGPQALAEVEELLVSGACGCGSGTEREAASGGDSQVPLARALLARSAKGEALALKLLAASPGVKPAGRAGSLAVAASSGADEAGARGARLSSRPFFGPAFDTLRELLRRGCTADATEALHVVLRALPSGHELHGGEAHLVVRSLLAAGADAAAPVPGFLGYYCNEDMSVLALVGDATIAEELVRGPRGAFRDRPWRLSQLVRVPLQQSLEYLYFLRDLDCRNVFRVDDIELVLERAMRCGNYPFEHSRLDALEFLHYELLRVSGSLRGLRNLEHVATLSQDLGTFKHILSRLCKRLTFRGNYSRIARGGPVLNPMSCCVKQLLESEVNRRQIGLSSAIKRVDDANDDLSAVREDGVLAEGSIWWEQCRRRHKPSMVEQAAGDRALLRLLLDSGARLPRGADDLPLVASMLIEAVAAALRGGSDATQPMRELITALHASAGDTHEAVVPGERWQAVGAAVQATLDECSALDVVAARTARAADRADASCVSNWPAMRALVTDMEAAACRDDVEAAETAATSMQLYRATLHVAAGRRAVADNATSKRARLAAAIVTAMQQAPIADDAAPPTLQGSTPDAEVLHLRAACGKSVSVPRALATRSSEVLAAMTARWAADEPSQPLRVAELSVEQLQYFSAFIAEPELDDHAHEGAWEAAVRAAPSSVDWAALESAAGRAVGVTWQVERDERVRRLFQAVVAAGALGSSRMQLAAALAATALLRDDTQHRKRKSEY